MGELTHIKERIGKLMGKIEERVVENQIVSLSGGKDSTAMLLMMIERGEKIHSAVFFDTGWEFPEMQVHLDQLESMVDIPIVRLVPERSFDYWMYERQVIARKGSMKGKVHRIGNGWPSPMRRWCTRQKVDAIKKYTKTILNVVECIGYAYDEPRRYENVSKSMQKNTKKRRFPLVEYGVTESDAIRYCKLKGFDWGGLYDVFDRVSCFCCPLQRIGELRKLRDHYPEIWDKMLSMDASIPGHNKGFRGYESVKDLDRRFANEKLIDSRQLKLFTSKNTSAS